MNGPRDTFGADADERTLRLSSFDVGPAEVEAFIAYQRSLREELEFSPVCHAGWIEQLAEAHRRSLVASGLDARKHSRVSSVATDFCGRRLTVRALRKRLDGADEAERGRIEAELRRLDDLGPLERRHGAAVVSALRAREDELVTLHEQLTPLLTKG